MRQKYKSFYINIAVLVVFIVLALLCVFYVFIRTRFVRLFEDDYNRRTLSTNELIIARIDGDKIEEYSKTFSRDTYYFSLIDSLYKLKNILSVKYLYIMADTGDPESYYYIFDAVPDEETNIHDDSRFGTRERKELFPGADTVLKTGLPFERARKYSDEKHGFLYYAFAPIINSRGKVVGFLGTDIDAAPMRESIRNFQMTLIWFGLLIFCAVFLFIIFYGKRYLSDPILKMTEDIINFSQGNLNITFSPKLLLRKDEFGSIYRAFSEVTAIITNMISAMNRLTSEVARGNLSSRIENGRLYQGSYEEFVDKANRMLDNNRGILDMMPNAVIFYDDRAVKLYQNNPARTSYSTAPEAGGFDVNEILERNSGLIAAASGKFFADPRSADTQTFTFTDANGDARHFNAFFIKTGNAAVPSGVCAVFTDVSEYVDMSKKAEASSRAKTEFLSRVSHEIRTPMNAIIGMTEIAKKQTPDAKVSRSIDTIETSAKHLLALINDILDISKIEFGNFQIFSVPFDLAKTMKSVISIFSRQAAEKDIGIKLLMENFDPGDLYFTGDETRIRQVIINLIGNAVKFSHPDSEILVSLFKLPAEKTGFVKIRFSVRDFGIGISPENTQKIFEVFEQGESGIARIYGGTGLGLPLSDRIVKLMGGENIAVVSEKGRGSEFSFTLELEKAEMSPESSEVSAAAPGNASCLKGKRVLVVDDIEINREIVISLLEDSGAGIDCADDGTAAVEMFAHSPPGYYDLVLMDIQMKIMDGYTAARTIRNSGRPDSGTVKIIAMSANTFQAEDINAAINAGMNSYITKPINYEEMMKTIYKILSGESA
jgi:signal transduction histidine kinase/CheY-like chemotaxis protein